MATTKTAPPKRNAAPAPAAKPEARKQPARPGTPPPIAADEEAAKAGAVASRPEPRPVPMQGDDASGEVDSSDIIASKFKIIHNVGDLSEKFPDNIGSFLLGSETVLNEVNTKASTSSPLTIIVVTARKRFQENLKFGESEDMPRVFDTLAEVKEAGGHTDWVDNQKPPYSPMLEASILVEKPEGLEDDSLFVLEHEGKQYAPAMWRITNSAYTRAGKHILTTKALLGGKPLVSRKFVVSTKREKLGPNWVWCPAIRNAGISSEAFVQFVQENLR